MRFDREYVSGILPIPNPLPLRAVPQDTFRRTNSRFLTEIRLPGEKKKIRISEAVPDVTARRSAPPMKKPAAKGKETPKRDVKTATATRKDGVRTEVEAITRQRDLETRIRLAIKRSAEERSRVLQEKYNRSLISPMTVDSSIFISDFVPSATVDTSKKGKSSTVLRVQKASETTSAGVTTERRTPADTGDRTDGLKLELEDLSADEELERGVILTSKA